MSLRVHTFRFKILLVVIVVVVSMTATIQVVVQREINKAMLVVNEENALNLLDAVVMHVESEYKSILFHEQNTLENRQRELRNVVSIALYCLDLYYQQYRQGALSEEEAKQRAKDALSGLRYDDDVGYLWINDMERPVPRMVMHPTMPELDGLVLDDKAFYCALGATQNLFVASVDVCEAAGAGYVDYLWPKPTATGLTEDQPKISYVARFAPWNWVVGTGVYIDDIEEETRKRFDAVLAELRNAFLRMRIAKTGYLFVFSEDKQMLIHPVVEAEADTQDLLNPESGNNILDELILAAETPARPFVYRWNKPETPSEYSFLKKTYVRYFPPLNWYIAASFYNREIEQPARVLQAKILLFSLVVLLVAVLLAAIASSSLLRPLKKLTHAAKEIGAGRKTEALVPVSGTVETIELGQILNDMIESLKASEKDLKRANSYIENIINSMPSILVGVDADGRITQWNDGAQQATGTSSSEALGQSVEQVLPRINAEMERIREALKQRTVQSHIKCAYKEQGETRYEDVTIYPLVTNGVEGVVVRIDDVTERVRVEEMMVQSEKMLSVGGLAAGMAHEINNPLAGMMQTADVMTNRLTGRLAANERAAEEAGTTMEAIHRFMHARGIPNMLHNIRESGRRAAEIVQNMLSFARKSNAAVSSHNLVELLDQILELAATDYDLKKQYDFKRIDIRKDYEELLPMVPCEGAKIQQVVLNLVRNAAEAMQEAGTEQPILTVKAYQDQEREMVCMEVQDNGPGMDEETQKRVFDPFFTTKPAGEGTGLGLSVSYFIITENHHGEMEVESQLGVGTRFVIRIPLRSPAS